MDRLKSGVNIWNLWRDENPREQIFLRAADLRGLDLQGANLGEARLNGVNLSDADLRGAMLTGAYINRADLTGVNLSEARLTRVSFRESRLSGANLFAAKLRSASLIKANLEEANIQGGLLLEANLTGANFSGADLQSANLSGANLTDADLSTANIAKTVFNRSIFSNVEMGKVKGVESCRHLGPSILDRFTIENSPQLPDGFLRGCGYPDTWIAYIRSLTANPIEFYSCFISYSHEDKSFAQRLHDQLQSKGIRCWLDDHQLLPGDDVYEQVDRGIKLWDKVLLCCSEACPGD